MVDECPEVLKKWQKEKIYPKTCYFIKKEQFVCCPLAMGVTTMETITVRTTLGTTSGPSLLELTGLRRSDLGKRKQYFAIEGNSNIVTCFNNSSKL